VIEGLDAPLVVNDNDSVNSRIDYFSESFLALRQSPVRFEPLVSEHQAPLSLRVSAFCLHELRYVIVYDDDVAAR
jgi:hypothetical protein